MAASISCDPSGVVIRVRQGVRLRVRATMGFYAEWILPSLIDLSMRNKRLRPYRERTAGAAEGRVLDIGIGSGPNLSFYARKARQIFGLDPSPALFAPAASKAPRTRNTVPLPEGSARRH